MIQFTLPDGKIVGTGLLMPVNGKVSTFRSIEELEGVGKVKFLSKSQIQKIAKSGEMDGRKKFDKSWVKNQRHHGSCNGFAGASALSKARVDNGQPRVDLSGAYLYSLINGGMDRGSMLDDGMNRMRSGLALEETVGWDQIYPGQYDRIKAQTEAERFKGLRCAAVESADGYWNALALGGKVVTAVHAGGRFNRTEGVDGVAGVDNGPGNHAVHADGLCWVGELGATAQNSWATSWGVEGRMVLLETHYIQPAEYHMTYAIWDVSEDADDMSELPTLNADGIEDAVGPRDVKA